MRRQLQGIALILFSLLLMMPYGSEPVFDFSFRWSAVFVCLGAIGLFMACIPDGLSRNPRNNINQERNEGE